MAGETHPVRVRPVAASNTRQPAKYNHRALLSLAPNTRLEWRRLFIEIPPPAPRSVCCLDHRSFTRQTAEDNDAAPAQRGLCPLQPGNTGRAAHTAPAPVRASISTLSHAFAANVLPVVRQIQAAGATTHRAIAEALNARGIRTARGGQWHVSTVQNLLAREGVAGIID